VGTFDKVAAGTPSDDSPSNKANWINAVSEATEDYHTRKRLGQGGKAPLPLKDNDTWVKVKNLSGSDLLRGHYLQVGDYLLDELDFRSLWFEGNVYSASNGRKVAVLRQAALDDDIVKAQMSGVGVARINVRDTAHQFAEPIDTRHVLRSSDEGSIEILSVPSPNGGPLTTRTDADTGTVTMDDSGHSIETGDTVNVYWAGGERIGMTVGTVSGTSVPVDGGSGNDLPAQDTDVFVSLDSGEELAVLIGGGGGGTANVETAGALARVVLGGATCSPAILVTSVEGDPDSLGGTLHTWCNNGHGDYNVSLPDGALVLLIGLIGWEESSSPSCPDIYVPENFPTAILVNPVDFLAGLPDFAAFKALFADTGGTAADIKWGGRTCEPPAE
jgi:hypothetical protein